MDNYKKNSRNIYESYANKKENCNSEFIVDAHDYFNMLYNYFMDAKESIYICGWWVSPELYLKRPCNINSNNDNSNNKINNKLEISSRLMDVLLYKAKQGIQINILIYKEVSMAMTIDSSHTKFSFEKLHDNIKVKKIIMINQ
jgi:phospholipase D1/2